MLLYLDYYCFSPLSGNQKSESVAPFTDSMSVWCFSPLSGNQKSESLSLLVQTMTYVRFQSPFGESKIRKVTPTRDTDVPSGMFQSPYGESKIRKKTLDWPHVRGLPVSVPFRGIKNQKVYLRSSLSERKVCFSPLSGNQKSESTGWATTELTAW